MLGISLTAQGCFLLAALIVSARRTARTKSAFRGGICLYGLFVLGAALFCIVIPGILVGLGADNHKVAHAFPEAIGVPAAILVYWIPAFGFAGMVRVAQNTSGKKSASPGFGMSMSSLLRLMRRDRATGGGPAEHGPENVDRPSQRPGDKKRITR
jgi:hypothetical protein